MKWCFLLLAAVLTKTLLTKALMLGLILLLFWLKGKALQKASSEWKTYFLTLKESFINRCVVALYSVSAVLSACVVYGLLKVSGFQDPLLITGILTGGCAVLSFLKYNRKGKQKVEKALEKIQTLAQKERV